jgi:asparagine synthase (glutamine-hydrolysing)
MIHGGPYDFGTAIDVDSGVCLGHRRLSILDLSSAGHQPMFDEQQNIGISYNGEIYNFKILKEELIQLGISFKTQTDTEVIIQAYLFWGEAAFAKFNGICILFTR